jgi:hypothetical protein
MYAASLTHGIQVGVQKYPYMYNTEQHETNIRIKKSYFAIKLSSITNHHGGSDSYAYGRILGAYVVCYGFDNHFLLHVQIYKHAHTSSITNHITIDSSKGYRNIHIIRPQQVHHPVTIAPDYTLDVSQTLYVLKTCHQD